MPPASRRLRRAAGRLVTPPAGARRHLAPGLELEDFFAVLKQRQVCYVVLRWFDQLPRVDAGEDVDLLVADDDLEQVRGLMSPRAWVRATQAFDIYSVGGLPGSDFRGVPYYSPRFARAVLADGEWLHDSYRVPSLQHHYLSLAYHAVYHKGYASGLPDSAGAAPRQQSDHDYEGVLAELATRLGQPRAPTLDSLDRHLADQDLRPPRDTLERLEAGNPWVYDRFFADQPQVDRIWTGLAVFVLRERARPHLDVAVQELDRQGFEVLQVVELSAEQSEAASHLLRGGNWERGPWPVSGGPPSTYVIAYDVAPQLNDPDDLRGTNVRIPRAKELLRSRLLAGVAPDALYNPVHSSDNALQALDYLDALGTGEVRTRVQELAQQLVESVSWPYPVLRPLPGQARRAQVAVVEHPVHGPSVCKVFRPGAMRFFERELRAREHLGDLPEVPGLLERGANWILTPLYDDDGSHVRRHLPGRAEAQLVPGATAALVAFALALHERGLFLLDLSTHNLVSDPAAGLKVLDLEFLQEYAGAAPAPAASYTFHGVPTAAQGYDVPQRTSLTAHVGGSAFHPAVTGSSVDALLAPRRPLDGPRRALVQVAWYLLLLEKERVAALRTRVLASPWGRDVRKVRQVVRRLRHR